MKQIVKRMLLKRMLLKLTSAKLWITIWAMVIVTYMVFTKQVQNNQTLIIILSSVPLAYCGLNVLQKNIENKGRCENE